MSVKLIPTLEEVVEKARQGWKTNLPGSDAWIWPNNIYVAARVTAGLVYGNFLWLDYIARQRFISTSDGHFLNYHGRDHGVIRLSPSFAEGIVDLLGTPDTSLPAGLVFSYANDQEYELLDAVQFGDNGGSVGRVRALEAGRLGNIQVGVNLSPTTTIEGLQSVIVNADGIGGGADEEEDEPYRSRLLFHVQNPTHGGNRADYIRWTREINSGITHVAVDDMWAGASTGAVYLLMRDTYENGIPQQSDVKQVQAWLDHKRPVGTIITVLAPEPTVIDIVITGLSPDSVAVRDAVKLELEDLFARGVTISTRENPISVRSSKIWEAISSAAGEDYHTLVSPASDMEVGAGHVPVLGSISFV